MPRPPDSIVYNIVSHSIDELMFDLAQQNPKIYLFIAHVIADV